MIYFIITTCIFNDCEIRKLQYINGITKLKNLIYNLDIQNYKIIIVENNGLRDTFLDTFGCEVYYTENNFLPNSNKGYKELQDVFDCITKFSIKDSDFVVKITGRYILHDNSDFMDIIKDIHKTNYDCVIKYGSFFRPVNYKTNDCITGLIGMKCFFVKQIEKPMDNECVEWKWASVTNFIDDNNICILHRLGINICPSSNYYFPV